MSNYDILELSKKIYPWVFLAWQCMVKNVQGFSALEKKSREESYEGYQRRMECLMQSYTANITLWLYHGVCPCGLKVHAMRAFPTSDLSLDRFLECAVTGPKGLPRTRGSVNYRIKANSFSQGMFFHLVKEDYKVANRRVAFTRCENHNPPQYHYSGQQCCTVCNAAFNDEINMTVARDWIVLRNKFHEVRRWRCKCGNLYSLRYQKCHLRSCTKGNPSHGKRVFHVWIPNCDFQTHTPAPMTITTSEEHERVIYQAVLDAMRKLFENIQGWQHILFVFIMREDPHNFSTKESWRAILQGGYQPSDTELLDLGFSIKELQHGHEDRYTFQRVEGGIISAEIWRQIKNHAQEIAKWFDISEIKVPKEASAVRQQIRRQANAAGQLLKQELEINGIDWDIYEQWRRQQQNRNPNREISGENDDAQ